MHRIFVGAASALGLAAAALLAASPASADTGGINYTVGPVSYRCSPCTPTSANTTTTITTGGTTQTISTRVPNTQEFYLRNTTTTASGTTSTNYYAGDLGLWGGRSITTPQGATTGFQAGYYAKSGTVKITPTNNTATNQ